MADVQCENGYTTLAHEILEHMARIKLSPTQYRLIFVIWRYTYGFKRKEHDLSLAFLSNATGCDKRQIQRELKGLENKKVVVQIIKPGSNRKIAFNKNYDEWIGKTDNGETAIGGITVGETDNGEIDNGEIDNITIGEIVKGTIGEIDNQERYKDININTQLLHQIEGKKSPSSKAGVIVHYLNDVFPERKKFGSGGNIKANKTFTTYIEEGNPIERLLEEISKLKNNTPPWEIVKLAKEKTYRINDVEKKRTLLRDQLALGVEYYISFGGGEEAYHSLERELEGLG